jgi:hypothetical protein
MLRPHSPRNFPHHATNAAHPEPWPARANTRSARRPPCTSCRLPIRAQTIQAPCHYIGKLPAGTVIAWWAAQASIS